MASGSVSALSVIDPNSISSEEEKTAPWIVRKLVGVRVPSSQLETVKADCGIVNDRTHRYFKLRIAACDGAERRVFEPSASMCHVREAPSSTGPSGEIHRRSSCRAFAFEIW